MHPTNCFNTSASMSKLVSLQGSKTEVYEGSLPKPVLDEKEKVKGTETQVVALRRRRGGPPDLLYAKKSNNPAPQSVLATARVISDINAVSYPEGVSSPNPALNQNVKDGKFRYDRDFLLQFLSLCKAKPPSLSPLEMIGLELLDPSSLNLFRPPGRHRTSSSALLPAKRGFSSNTLGKGTAGSFNQMGNFATPDGSKLNSEDRFAASNRALSVTGDTGMPFGARPVGLPQTTRSGPGRWRTHSKRGEKRIESNRFANAVPGPVSLAAQHHTDSEPVAPLQATGNRWVGETFQADADSSPEMVDRKVKSLLNKLTMKKFHSISDQVIQWANKSENEKDGRTLIQVTKLVFEMATDQVIWCEMYARLCRKMMEQISSKVQDDGIENNGGKPIAGGQLFRKYLLNRCWEDFERGWVAKEAAAAATTKALEDKAVKAANEKRDEQKEEHALFSEEYYAAQKAKRQGLGLIRFIGELFKLQMFTERIMHECVKKLLANVENLEEVGIESLCTLLTTVGGILDTKKARAHMDVYFSRMKGLTKNSHVTPRMKFMVQDVLELRERKWVSRQTKAMTALARFHAPKEKEARQPITLKRGPGNVDTTKQPDSNKDPISRATSSTNTSIISMLSSQNAAAAKSVEPQRKRLILQPRSKPVESIEPAETSSHI